MNQHSHPPDSRPPDAGKEPHHDQTSAHQAHHGHHPADEGQGHHHDHHNGHQGHGDHHAHMVADFRRRFWISLVVSLPVVALSPMIQNILGLGKVLTFPGDIYLLFILSTFIFLYGGYPFLSGLFRELRTRSPGMMTLIGVAIITAYGYSAAVVFGVPGRVFFWELSTLIVIMLLGHWIEMKSVMGASGALKELARLMPSEAHRIGTDGQVTDVPLDQLGNGDTVLVKPGEKIPADGHVADGHTSINESMITGESQPVEKKEGDEVIGGSVNGEGSIRVRISKTGEESYLNRMMKMVEEAQASKSRTQNLADRAAFWLTIVALASGAVTLVIWLTLMQREFVFALERSVTVMVITCPHALGLAIPLVIAVSTALAARNGLLIRNRNAFESARRIEAILFDKTGTLTVGEFGITDVLVLDDTLDQQTLQRYAAAVEARSEHPIGRAIAAAADAPPEVDDFQAIPGKGVRGRVEGRMVKVVSPGYLDEHDLDIDHPQARELAGQGKTLAYILLDDQPAGVMALADKIRPESQPAIARLKEMGIRCMMLTGDNEKVAAWVARETGLDEYFAGVLPDRKAAKVKEVQARGLVVAMTGDGVNDAPALAQADVGIAIGAGTDVAMETSDIVLVKSNPQDVVSLLNLSRSTYRKMIQNLFWATGYNVVAIPLAAGALYSLGILLSPAIGAFIMSLSTVIVAINARFLKI